jgi:GIY-YIG catalytic domain
MTIIYKLVFPNTNRVYVGQTNQDIEIRFAKHISKLIGSNHHSYKLQQAWPECGYPKYEILETCDKNFANIRESHWILQLNAYKNGFNCTELGNSPGVGFNHCAAKLSEDDYRCIVIFLAQTNMTHLQISEELSVPIGIIESISAGYSHTNLLVEMPEEYTLMISKNRKGLYQLKDRPNITSPEGIVYYVTNVSEFARIHNLVDSCIRAVLLGKRKSHAGWRLTC